LSASDFLRSHVGAGERRNPLSWAARGQSAAAAAAAAALAAKWARPPHYKRPPAGRKLASGHL